MEKTRLFLKKLDNLTYLLQVVRDEIENTITDTLLELGDPRSEKLEVPDVAEDDGGILEGFSVFLDDEKGLLIEFRDGQVIPLCTMDTDDMYDYFVRIHSALMDDAVSYN